MSWTNRGGATILAVPAGAVGLPALLLGRRLALMWEDGVIWGCPTV